MDRKKLQQYFERTRKDFPILNQQIFNHPLIYADNAATSQTPKQVIQSIVEYYEQYNSNIHRGIHSLADRATEAYEKARDEVASFIGASHKEVIFTSGTTDGLNMLSRMLEPLFEEGDEIVLTQMEHHANLVPWQELARRMNLVLKFIPYNEKFELNLDEAKKLITKKTKIVALPHASNVLGTVNPIKKISDIAHKQRAIVVLDAAQTVAYMPVDVKKLGCDFMVFSGHKMCGPTGIGVLYGEQAYLENFFPVKYGGGMIEDVQLKQSTFQRGAQKYETGTPHVEGVIALAEAVRYLKNLGMENVHRYMNELSDYMVDQLEEVPHLTLFGPEENRSATFSFRIDNVHSLDMSHLLNSKGIAIRTGQHCAIPLIKSLGETDLSRVSLYFYNSFEEIDTIIEELKKISQRFN